MDLHAASSNSIPKMLPRTRSVASTGLTALPQTGSLGTVDMHKLIIQANRTFLLFIFTHSNYFQFSCTSHCSMISDIHDSAILVRSKFNLSNLDLISYCKTCGSSKYICYDTNTNVYESPKLTIVSLALSTNLCQPGSETRMHRSYSIYIDWSSNGELSSSEKPRHVIDKLRMTPATSSPEKPRHRIDKLRTTPATEASPRYARNNTKYKHKHLRKLDKRSKQKESRANSSNQGKARRNSGIKLKG